MFFEINTSNFKEMCCCYIRRLVRKILKIKILRQKNKRSTVYLFIFFSIYLKIYIIEMCKIKYFICDLVLVTKKLRSLQANY